MKINSNKKGFTLIELIVVISILGILVLLATPRFTGYTKDAKDIQIANDIRAYEVSTMIEKMDNPELTNDWLILSDEELATVNGSGKVLNKKKEVVSNLGGKVYIVQDIKVNSSLDGTFLLNENDEVFYYDGEVNGVAQPPKFPPTDETNFEWIVSPAGYNAVGQSQKGYYRYKGTDLETVVIPDVIKGTPMTSYKLMFSGTNTGNIKKVVSTNKNITDMTSMFVNSQMTSLDLSDFETSGVSSMSGMFYSSKVETLNVSGFKTSNVTDMSLMFQLSKVKSLNLRNFDTSNVLNMNYMFALTSNLTSLDVSRFNTSKVTTMESMFSGNKATTLNVSGFNTSSVTNMSYMFLNSEATTLDVRNFNTSNVTNMSAMFENTKAKSLDLRNFDFSKVTNMSLMLKNTHLESKRLYVANQTIANRLIANANVASSFEIVVGN